MLALWLVMLVSQAQLIRMQRRSLHRQLGKLSYVLAPAVVLVTTVFVDQRIAFGFAGVARLPAPVLHSLALMPSSLVAFAVFYGLAIAKRRLDVFPVALGVLLVYHLGTLTLHRVPAWNAFGVWFLGLPLP